MTLFLGQVRMPDVKDEDDAGALPLITGFVFDGIVKHPRFAALPQADLIANPEPATIGDQQGQMAHQARI